MKEKSTQLKEIKKSEDYCNHVKAHLEGDKVKQEKFESALLRIMSEKQFKDWNARSIVNCGLQALEIGLDFNKVLHQVYFVAYKNKPQLAIGYRGWQTLLERAGKAVKAHPVYKCDSFSFEIQGFEENYSLVPEFSERKESDAKWVYDNLKGIIVAIKNIETSIVTVKYIHREKLDQLRGESASVQQNKFSPWVKYPLEMFMAKAIKYVISKTAMTPKVARAVQIETETEIAAMPSRKRPSKIAEDIRKKKTQEVKRNGANVIEPRNKAKQLAEGQEESQEAKA